MKFASLTSVALLFGVAHVTNSAANSTPIRAQIQVDASKSLGELKPIRRFFGADEPNYAYMKNGEKLLREYQIRPGSRLDDCSVCHR